MATIIHEVLTDIDIGIGLGPSNLSGRLQRISYLIDKDNVFSRVNGASYLIVEYFWINSILTFSNRWISFSSKLFPLHLLLYKDLAKYCRGDFAIRECVVKQCNPLDNAHVSHLSQLTLTSQVFNLSSAETITSLFNCFFPANLLLLWFSIEH